MREKTYRSCPVSVEDRSLKVVETLHIVEGELHDIVPGQSVLDDGRIDAGGVNSSLDVLFLPCIDAAPDGDSLPVPASN